jgi:hypothetical protein
MDAREREARYSVHRDDFIATTFHLMEIIEKDSSTPTSSDAAGLRSRTDR